MGTRTILLAAWGSLVVALVAIVISLLTSQRVLRESIASLEQPSAAGATRPTDGPAARLTAGLNWLAGAGLVAGLALLGWYALANT